MHNADSKTFTPDGSAQLWAVVARTGDRPDERFIDSAPVVGWLALEEAGTSYTVPAVHDATDPLFSGGVQPVADWTGDSFHHVELVHVSQLAETVARFEMVHLGKGIEPKHFTTETGPAPVLRAEVERIYQHLGKL